MLNCMTRTGPAAAAAAPVKRAAPTRNSAAPAARVARLRRVRRTGMPPSPQRLDAPFRLETGVNADVAARRRVAVPAMNAPFPGPISGPATVAAVTQPVSHRQRRPADGPPTVDIDDESRAGEDGDVPIDRGGNGRIGN